MATTQGIPVNQTDAVTYDPVTGLNKFGWGTAPPPDPNAAANAAAARNALIAKNSAQKKAADLTNQQAAQNLQTSQLAANKAFGGAPGVAGVSASTQSSFPDSSPTPTGPFTVGGTFPTIQPTGDMAGGATGGGAAGGGGPVAGLSNFGRVAPIAMPDTTAADAASLNRTKDTVGQQGAGALRGLRESLGARGMLGSGLESRGTEQLAEAGLGQLGDVTRQQQIDNSNRAQKTNEMNYQGELSQRGQDIQNAQAGYQGGITQRGQDLSYAAQMEIAKNQKAAQQAQALQGLLGIAPTSGFMY